MFLIGGPAYSGTTLLALLLNQGKVVCLDEPDFHNPEQSHRGIPLLERLFPDRTFPARPSEPLTHAEAVTLMRACEEAIRPYELGMKTCNRTFLDYAAAYRDQGFPVVAIVRDVRDALVTPLPPKLDPPRANDATRVSRGPAGCGSPAAPRGYLWDDRIGISS